MPNYPKTIKLLLTLSPKECSLFKKHLDSPCFNNINAVTKLYNNIIHLYKDKKQDYNEAELVQMTYQGFKLNTYQSHLKRLKEHFENFTAIQIIENDPLKKAIANLEDYLDRSNGCFFEIKYRQTKRLLESYRRDTNYFQFLYEIESLKDAYIKLYKDKRTGDTNLQAVSDAIDIDFITKKLCYVVLMLNRQNITKIKYDFGFKEFVLKYLGNTRLFNKPIINLFYLAFQILEKENKKEAFEKLNQHLLNKNYNISTDLIFVLYTILHNNTKPVFKTRHESNIQYFKLYDTLLKKKYIHNNGKISTNFFKNVITVCLALDKFDYIKSFMMLYKHKLYPEDLAKDAFAFFQAKLLLYRGKLAQAEQIMVNLYFKDSRYILDLKCLKIMLNYELQEFDALEFQISSFQVRLTPNRTKNLSARVIKENKNFINCFNKLYRLSISPNTTNKDVLKFIDNIEHVNHIKDPKWLITKAEKLLDK